MLREVREETHLEVSIERILMEQPTPGDRVYEGRKTYLCRVLTGEPTPGEEPEPEHNSLYSIAGVRWLDLADDGAWDEPITSDAKTYPELVRIRLLLGYEVG